MEKNARVILGGVLGGIVMSLGFGVFALAATTGDEVQALQDQIANRRATISDLNKSIDDYRKQINAISAKSASLATDVALLDNEIAMNQLDVAATENEIDAQNLEIQITEDKIAEAEATYAEEQAVLSSLLFTLNKYDGRGSIDMIFGSDNFHDVFSAIADIETVNDDVKSTLATTALAKAELESQKHEHETRLADLVTLKSTLAQKLDRLDAQKSSKTFLLAETQETESGYIVLMSELRAEQQGITSQISALQKRIEEKITESDSASGGGNGMTVITWPTHGIITTLFHDPSYPFRNLFAHSGLDIAVPVGTPVEASAPGYVAWAKTGTMYGNYIMIVHANGLATLYAHLSRMDVKADDYVSRGQIIGLTGGRPGMQGAGFSTGPHLHFEVRKDGIPDNPLNYLVNE